MEHLIGASLGVRWAPTLPANIRLDWNGLPGTSAIAYREHLKIMDGKGFITSGQVPML